MPVALLRAAASSPARAALLRHAGCVLASLDPALASDTRRLAEMALKTAGFEIAGWDQSAVADVLAVDMPTRRRLEAATVGGILKGMTAKEQLLKEAPGWNETQAAAALRVVHGGVDPDLEALLEEEGDEILAEMDAREDEVARRASKA
jgi:hypothetical protein